MTSILAKHNHLSANIRGIFARGEPSDFRYSDGQGSESYLQTVFSEVSDRSTTSVELENRIVDWPSEYHLSYKRHNLLRFLNLDHCRRVLELGCGCGAISRYLGEKGIEVDAVEGSPVRAALAKARCRDVDNVNIINANYNDLELPAGAYDAVLFIGVLEYAGKFLDSANSHENALLSILGETKKALKSDGIAIVAIENRLGLKYLLGAGEDHYSKPWIGLYGYPDAEGIKTYSYNEWQQLLDQSDYRHHEFACCFPDYKIPTTILSANYLDQSRGRVHLLDSMNSRDYTGYRQEFEDEKPLLKGFAEAGDLLAYANSWLIVLGDTNTAVQKCLAFDFLHCSDYSRRPEFRTVTTKHRDSNTLDKHRLFPLLESSLLRQEYRVADYCDGELLSEIWARDLQIHGEISPLLAHLRQYLDFLQSVLTTATDSGAWIDLLPFNIVVDKTGDLHAIDQEWVWKKPVTAHFLLFRSLFYFISRYKHSFSRIYDESTRVGHIIGDCFKQLDLSDYDRQRDAYIAMEDELQGIIRSPKALSSTALELSQTISKYKFHPVLYWRHPKEQTDPEKSLVASASFGEDRQEIEFQFTHWGRDDEPVELRFDPAEQEGFFHIYQFMVSSGMHIGDLKSVLLDINGHELAEKAYLHNTDYGFNGQGDIYVSRNDDPQIVLLQPITLKHGEIVRVCVSMSWPRGMDYRIAQSKYIAEHDAMQRQQLAMEDELQRLRVSREELNLIKQSRVWRAAEILRKLLYVDTLGKIPGLQRSALAISRRNWKRQDQKNRFLRLEKAPDPYLDILAGDDHSVAGDNAEMKERITRFEQRPLFSIVMPTWNPPPAVLDAAIESINSQVYEHWELCLVDDASPDSETRDYIARINHPKIRVRENRTNRNIAETTNRALQMASGDYIIFMDNDDLIPAHALFEMANAINGQNAPDMLYSDEDFLSEDGARINPHFKPDYSPDLLLSHNYITHLVAIKRSLVQDVGPLDSDCDGAQDYDFLLRATEKAESIVHIPKVLYHWRMSRSSTSMDSETKPAAINAARKALEKALLRRNIDGEVLGANLPHFFRVKRRVQESERISIVIPFKDRPDLLEICLNSILNRSTWSNFEIIGVCNNSELQETFDLMRLFGEQDERIRFVEYNVPFNFSAVVNHGAQLASGDHLVLLNNDIEVISGDWMEAMLEHSQRPEIGAVGAKLYYANNTVQHAGIVVGIGGYAGHGHKHFAARNTGYFNRLNVIQNVSAVTGALLMVKKSLYDELGGFDEETFKVACNDVDFCLRLVKAGYRNIFTPYARAYHYESSSRGYEDTPDKKNRFDGELQRFRHRHADFLEAGDPYYNPNLTLTEEHFGLKTLPVSD